MNHHLKFGSVEAIRAQEKTALGMDSLLRLLFKSPQQPQQSIENSQRMRWPARDEQINRNNRSCAVIDLRVTRERPTGDGARTHGNGNLWLGHSIPGFFECELHIFGNRSSNDQPICVARRSDELN